MTNKKSNQTSKKSTPDQQGANYLVLARKYRPTNFSGLIGQDAMVQTLTNAFEAERLAHAFILSGVRGVGKTTTIGKLTKHIKSEGKSILLAAADTFRAAATEQLSKWGNVNGVNVISQGSGSDPGAVVYNALQSARSKNIDVLIVDTAGRLHNKKNLMDEIKKINNVSNKFDISLKKETFLVLDAGTGQNALTQAKQFHDTIGIDRIILTKLDGTAKGGIVFALANELKIPISFIGIGEKIDDLQQFNASEFIDALLGIT